jgi:HPt (histidine-containing phosphotransfer) domain-containing protein
VEEPSVDETPAEETSSQRPIIQAACKIAALNVEKGLSLIAGEEHQYEDILRISVKVFSDGLAKMKNLYTDNIPAFAIEIHGMKSALRSIGAMVLGDSAEELEKAAKASDAGFCRDKYPVFEKQFAALAEALAAITQKTDARKGSGNTAELIPALNEAMDACIKFNSILASDIVAPFLDYVWEAPLDEALAGLADALDNIDYDDAMSRIAKLLGSLEG